MSKGEVCFNVGGKSFQVSRSLLEMHKDTMLFKSSTEAWQKDPESKIFIERDGERFRYCLDVMRDGKVSLPLSVSRDSVVMDLQYFGITFSAESVTYDLESMSYAGVVALKTECDEWTKLQWRSRKKTASYLALANFCASKHEDGGQTKVIVDSASDFGGQKIQSDTIRLVKDFEADAFNLVLRDFGLVHVNWRKLPGTSGCWHLEFELAIASFDSGNAA